MSFRARNAFFVHLLSTELLSCVSPDMHFECDCNSVGRCIVQFALVSVLANMGSKFATIGRMCAGHAAGNWMCNIATHNWIRILVCINVCCSSFNWHGCRLAVYIHRQLCPCKPYYYYDIGSLFRCVTDVWLLNCHTVYGCWPLIWAMLSVWCLRDDSSSQFICNSRCPLFSSQRKRDRQKKKTVYTQTLQWGMARKQKWIQNGIKLELRNDFNGFYTWNSEEWVREGAKCVQTNTMQIARMSIAHMRDTQMSPYSCWS